MLCGVGGSWQGEIEKERGLRVTGNCKTRKELYTLLFGGKKDKIHEALIETAILN